MSDELGRFIKRNAGTAARLGVCIGASVFLSPVAGALVSAAFNSASMVSHLVDGNNVQAGLDGAFCVFDLCTAGVASGACDAVKYTCVTTTKQASRTAVSKTTSEVTKQIVSGGAQQVAQQSASEAAKQAASSVSQQAVKEAAGTAARQVTKETAVSATQTVAKQVARATTRSLTKESVKGAVKGTTMTVMENTSKKVALQVSSQVVKMSTWTAGEQATIQVTKAVTKQAAVLTTKQATVRITQIVSKSTASCVVEAVANGSKVANVCKKAYAVGKEGKKYFELARESKEKRTLASTALSNQA